MANQPNRYSIDNGMYSRNLNPNGKANGIKKVALDIGRNDNCPCGSGNKFKRCCKPKGVFYVKKQTHKQKLKGFILATLKLRLRKLFKKSK